MEQVNFSKIEGKWQKRWDEKKIHIAKEKSDKKPYYVLEMFPYPSSAGLHMGHIRNYSMGDAVARYKRMMGFNVLYPMGYDSFGLPAENAAIKNKTHPAIYTKKAIDGIRKNQKSLGLSYDWTREIATSNPEYYKWNQWFFLQMFNKGLAYKKKSPVNWCPKCNTVLANEQVEGGKCWRCSSPVDVKNLEQWFLKITKYAKRLLKGLKKIDWPENVLKMQDNWIGRSEGTRIDFKIKDSDKKLSVFTTRPDTLFGITYMVYAPEHPDVLDLVNGTMYEKNVKEFIRKVVLEDRFERTSEDSEKEGVFIGRYVIHPVTGEELPIYIANFVLMEYGTGAIIAVPAHDQRDFMFAKKYDIPIKVVIQHPFHELDPENMSRAFCEEGKLVNSGEFDGMNNIEAISEITKFLKKKKAGKETVEYKLRDWGISRQRYWGTPIPIVYCKKCGAQGVREKDLPVLLPTDIKFTGGGNPLETSTEFSKTSCPKCKGPATRETDTMDTFFDSSWYFLRYCSPDEKKHAFSKKSVKYWLPVNQYIGGVEHAVMHLMYARFFTMVLHDLRLLDFDEPFTRLFNQGIVYKDGHKMSKSYGNAVTQEEISKKYGIDTARLFLLFVASPESQLEWNEKGVQGVYRFLNKLYRLVVENCSGLSFVKYKTDIIHDKILETKLNILVKNVSEQIGSFQFNLAISNIMEFVNYIQGYMKSQKPNRALTGHCIKTVTQLISPFAPHIAEELWEIIGEKGFVSMTKWPVAKKIDLRAMAVDRLITNLSQDIDQVLKLSKVKAKTIKLIVAPQWKYALFMVLRKDIEKSRDPGKVLKSVMSNDKFRPYGKEVSKLVPAIVKNPERIPKLILSRNEEESILNEVIDSIENRFKIKTELATAENTSSKKALYALPGKPGIEVL